MIEIKFRGKRKDNGEWVYGYYRKLNYPLHFEHVIHTIDSDDCCSDEYFQVIPETVGQYTGLKDSKGKEIYKGDIVEGLYGEESLVKFGIASLTEDYEYGDNRVVGFYLESDGQKFPIEDCYIKEIIGNEFDSPEILKRIKP